jgi:hypothetical protein
MYFTQHTRLRIDRLRYRLKDGPAHHSKQVQHAEQQEDHISLASLSP